MSPIGIVIAPVSAPQLPAVSRPPAPQSPVLSALDRCLLEVVGEHESIRATSVLNFLTSQQAPRNRSEERKLWLDAWHRLRRLLRLGLVYRAGRASVSLLKPVSEARRPLVRRRQGKPTVRPNTDEQRASTEGHRLGAWTKNAFEEPANEMPNVQRSTYSVFQTSEKTKCAPMPEEIAAAAQELARLPRRPKKWTGWLDANHRLWRGRRILLDNGREAVAVGALRGKVVWADAEHGLAGDIESVGRTWGVMSASQVTLVSDPNAQLLGRLKKGVREKSSPAKQLAARLNGSTPPRPGSKRRGRPRKSEFA